MQKRRPRERFAKHHCEEPQGVEDARLSTGFGDEAIQGIEGRRTSPLDCFAALA